MKIFLTGANGFVGRHLYPLLVNSGHDVDCGFYNELPLETPDVIIHLAAVTTTSQTFLPEMYDTNIVYAHKIMQFPCRIIYASSTSAAENTNPYAATKMYLEYLGAKHPNATGLRFFNVYGHGNNKGIVRRALECAKSGDKIDLYGGDNIRDFIHVSDVCRVIVGALGSPERLIEVGTGHGMTCFEAVTYVQFVTKSYFPINWMAGVSADMRVSVAKPGISGCLRFEEGIKLMI